MTQENPNIEKSKDRIITPEFLPEGWIQQYKHDGFIYIPNVLSQAEIGQYLTEAMRLFQEQEKVSWDEDEGNVMDWVADVETRSKLMRQLALHPGITGMAEKIAGTGLRLLKSELLLKRQSGSTITPMHIDDFAFPVSQAPDTLTVWVALVDVPVEKGCMTFMPRSHHAVEKALREWGERKPEVKESDWEDWLNPLNYLPELNWYPRVTRPLRAGDCTIHHSKTVHMAGANRTNNPRLSLTTVYTNINALYKAEDYTATEEDAYEEYNPKAFKGLNNGDPLPDALFPKVGSQA